MDIVTMMLPVILLTGICLSIAYHKGKMDMLSFMGSLAVGIGILIWCDIFPTYLAVVPMIIIGVMLFSGGDGNQ